jgi:hypothetical protein
MSPRRDNDLVNRRFEGWHARGFWPVRWAHHPIPIKDVIRTAGFRPLMKQCFRNCQLFALHNARLNLGLDVEYHEGWATSIIPFEHAWLVWRGKVVDLTLDDADEVGIVYGESTVFTPDDIRRNMRLTHTYSPVTGMRRFSEIHPLYEHFKSLNKRLMTGEEKR